MAIPRNLANIAPHVNASSTELVVNDGGANLDFRVEGDTDANLLFVDAGNERVGIGTNTPSGLLDVASRGITKGSLPAGSVLQVVYAQTTTPASTTSTSFVSAGLSASITPTSATSKILILGSAVIRVGLSESNSMHTIYRNATTNLAPTNRGFIQCRDADNAASDQTPSFVHLDSPATTSATTYDWYFKSDGGTSTTFAVDTSFAQITLMEIAA